MSSFNGLYSSSIIRAMTWAGNVVWIGGEMCTLFWWDNLKERDQLEDKDVEGRILSGYESDWSGSGDANCGQLIAVLTEEWAASEGICYMHFVSWAPFKVQTYCASSGWRLYWRDGWLKCVRVHFTFNRFLKMTNEIFSAMKTFARGCLCALSCLRNSVKRLQHTVTKA